MTLGHVLRSWRLHNEMDLRSAGKLIGITHVTLARVEHGFDPSGPTLAKIFSWLTAPKRLHGKTR